MIGHVPDSVAFRLRASGLWLRVLERVPSDESANDQPGLVSTRLVHDGKPSTLFQGGVLNPNVEEAFFKRARSVQRYHWHDAASAKVV